MKVTISEALRIKNEISAMVRNLEYKFRNQTIMGQTIEDGVIVTSHDGYDFSSISSNFDKILNYSEEINSKIADFNRDHDIDKSVRVMQNLKLTKEIFEALLPKSKSYTKNMWINVGDDRKKVTTEYKSDISSKELKIKINKLKNQIRELQSLVEKKNMMEIELSFNYSKLDELLME